jgi:hypothetical protein
MRSAITKACLAGLVSGIAFAPALASADPYAVSGSAPVVVTPAPPAPGQVVVQPGTVVTTPGQTYVAPGQTYVAPGQTYVVQPVVPANGSQVIVVPPDVQPTTPDVVYYHAPPVGVDYRDERARCESLPFLQRDQCTNRVNRMTSGVDPKCEKLSGFELDNCLLGADHGQ